ncbi:hypothetical protein AM500_19205 [Bacillus sp. FJAT-18017]|uniref:hypothetical protein n=1 Tax=Bacillus sp. FJAT-18017 TaxID=1705566 RepID=UPI0006AE9DB8|nr:hypothetical protein [Bacillus sp. FJAT-18017]ALC91673.1 hypothetical protein AM500_19205 [Bacillus sp. FJAT-18017]
MGTLFDLLGSLGALIFPFTKEVTEEEIERNIYFLKEYQWFQKYLDDDKFKNLIMEDEDVRFVIGTLNSKKMKKKTYYDKYQKKFQKILLKKLNSFKQPI